MGYRSSKKRIIARRYLNLQEMEGVHMTQLWTLQMIYSQ